MDRNEYLKLCQKCSVYSIKGIPSDLLVEYNGIKYYPKAYEMRFDNGAVKNTAILGDLKTNSIVYANMERVEKQ